MRSQYFVRDCLWNNEFYYYGLIVIIFFPTTSAELVWSHQPCKPYPSSHLHPASAPGHSHVTLKTGYSLLESRVCGTIDIMDYINIYIGWGSGARHMRDTPIILYFRNFFFPLTAAAEVIDIILGISYIALSSALPCPIQYLHSSTWTASGIPPQKNAKPVATLMTTSCSDSSHSSHKLWPQDRKYSI